VATDSTSPQDAPDASGGTGSVLETLMQVVESRRSQRPGNSYVVQLLDGGAARIGAKVQEEAAEVAQAAVELQADTSHLVHEVADLLFHTLVLLGWAGLTLSDVEAELKRRLGTSGLQERAGRGDSA
jgi:phosphoribosyl-ATP pyrophosphohydrolase